MTLEEGKSAGEVDVEISASAAVTLFVGTIQGLIIKALLFEDIEYMRRSAPETFALFRRTIRSIQ